jgi:hypothetical protein
MTKEERRLDLSGKLVKMGDALILEGRDARDGCVMQTGSTLLLLSSIIASEQDMFIFGEFISMFSAKKVLDDMEEKEAQKPQIGDEFISSLIDALKGAGSKLPTDEPKKVRKPRKKRGDKDEPDSGS